MAEIPGFWDVGPHDPLPVEATLQQFIREAGGQIVSDLISQPPSFQNADFLFEESKVVVELKEIETEFSNSDAFQTGLTKLINSLVAKEPDWRPQLFGGDGKYPPWFLRDFVRLCRPHISRILKKANKQIRETKLYFNIDTNSGIVLFVNDGFTYIEPYLVQAVASEILIYNYSSIDCFLYMTVNRYVELRGSNIPRLVWWPAYSERAADSLVEFVDALGRKWFDFLEKKVGSFTYCIETRNHDVMNVSKSIIPSE